MSRYIMVFFVMLIFFGIMLMSNYAPAYWDNNMLSLLFVIPMGLVAFVLLKK